MGRQVLVDGTAALSTGRSVSRRGRRSRPGPARVDLGALDEDHEPAYGVAVLDPRRGVRGRRGARISGTDALTPTPVRAHAMRTDSGRPSSSIRFRTWTPMATSVAW